MILPKLMISTTAVLVAAREIPKRFARFLTALAAAMRRHRNIVSYEIDNEENVQQW